MPAQPFQSRRRTSLSSPTRAAFGVSAVALGLGILPMSPASAAPQLYVSPAGSDVACDGSSPAAWTGSGQTCALQSIGAAIQAAEAGATIDVLAEIGRAHV